MNLYYERDNIESIELEYAESNDSYYPDNLFAVIKTKEGKWFRFSFDKGTDRIKIMFED